MKGVRGKAKFPDFKMPGWESPSAVQRRRQHERELERVGGPGTERGQELLDKWWRETLEQRRRSGEKVEERLTD